MKSSCRKVKNLASELAIELKHPATIKQERIVLTRTDLPELLRSKRSPLAVEFRPFKKRTKINVIVKGRNTKKYVPEIQVKQATSQQTLDWLRMKSDHIQGRKNGTKKKRRKRCQQWNSSKLTGALTRTASERNISSSCRISCCKQQREIRVDK